MNVFITTEETLRIHAQILVVYRKKLLVLTSPADRVQALHQEEMTRLNKWNIKGQGIYGK